jgi:hypothetical protein
MSDRVFPGISSVLTTLDHARANRHSPTVNPTHATGRSLQLGSQPVTKVYAAGTTR